MTPDPQDSPEALDAITVRAYENPHPQTGHNPRYDMDMSNKPEIGGLAFEFRKDIADLKESVGYVRDDIFKLNTAMTELKTEVTGLKTDMTGLKTDMTDGFNAINTRFDGVESRLANIETYMGGTAVLIQEVREIRDRLSPTEAQDLKPYVSPGEFEA